MRAVPPAATVAPSAMKVSSQVIQLFHGVSPPAQFVEVPPSTCVICRTCRLRPTTSRVLPATKAGLGS